LTTKDGIRTTLTNDQIYRDVKERALDAAGGFVYFVKGALEDEDNDENDDDELPAAPKVYQPPSATPDHKLSAGEVVEIVLEALRPHLDNPTPLYGMDVLFGYLSETRHKSSKKKASLLLNLPTIGGNRNTMFCLLMRVSQSLTRVIIPLMA
jgi:hypothetical protein